MNFRYTILYVADVTASIEFYERAFGLQRAMIHEDGDYAELTTGPTKLAFSSLALMQSLGKNPAAANDSGPAFEIAFETDDVAQAVQRATDAGAVLVQAAEQMPWGQTTSYVKDRDGFLIEICSPVKGSQSP